MDEKKIRLFETDPVPTAVAKLALPSIAATLVMILYNVADTYFVGLLKDPVESAAVTLSATALLAFNAVNNLFGVGSASMMSRSLGKQEYDTAKKTASFSFWLAFLAAVLFSVAYFVWTEPILKLLGADDTTSAATERYLFWTVGCGALPAILNVVLSNMVRSEGASLHSGIGVMSGCILNIILDPFFVLPGFLGLGAEGAGLATFLSNTVATLYLLGYAFVKRKETVVDLRPSSFCIRKDIVKEVFGVGVPASIQNLLNVTGTLILNNFTAVYGAAAVSAMGIAHKGTMLPMYITMGATQGIMPLISYNYASGNGKRMKDSISFVLKLSIVFTVVCTALFYWLAPEIIRVFLDNDEVVTFGGPLLRAMCLCIPFLSVDFTGVAVYQAIGKGSYSLAFAVARKVVLEIPALLLLNKLYPLYGMGYAQPIAEFILAIAAALLLHKIYRDAEAKPAGPEAAKNTACADHKTN